MTTTQQNCSLPATLPSPDGEFLPCPTVMTEDELVRFLRIPEISKATSYRHVIENLKRIHGLPRIHLCGLGGPHLGASPGPLSGAFHHAPP